MTRRPRGDGALHYDERAGLWVGRLELEPAADGKRRQRKVRARTKRAAAEKLRELRAQEHGGVDLTTRVMTVAELAEAWLTKVAPVRNAPSTLARTTYTIHHNVIPAVGQHRLDKLRPEHVEAWLDAEARAGKAKRTLEGYRLLLAEVLSWAQKRRLMTWNPARLAELPVGARPPAAKRSLTEDEAQRLLDALESERLGPYFATLLLLGLRPGEADALAWSAVDLDAGTVTISAALQRGDGGRPLAIGPTKTKASRVLSMPARVTDALRRQRVQQAQERLAAGPYWSQDWAGLVFTTDQGTPMHPSNMRRDLARICERADLPRLTPYELRHSAASLLVAAGVPPFEAADLLGHADLRMLERHYRHRLTPVVTAGPKALDAMFSSAR
jgi:integrase